MIILPGLLIMSACLGKYIAYSDILRKLAPRRFRAISTKLRVEMEKRGLNVTALTKGEKYALAKEAREKLKQRRKEEKARSKMHKRMKKERGWELRRADGRSQHSPMKAVALVDNLAMLPMDVDLEADAGRGIPLKRSVSQDSIVGFGEGPEGLENGYIETKGIHDSPPKAWRHSADSLVFPDELDTATSPGPDALVVIRGREDRVAKSAPYATISSHDSLQLNGRPIMKRHDPDAESVTLSLNLKGEEDAASVTNSLLEVEELSKQQREYEMMVKNEFSPEIEKYVASMRFWKRAGYFFGE